MNSVACRIYASSRREQMYLYVDSSRGLEAVPDTLLQQFGTPREVMELTLTPGRRLARADVATVLQSLGEQGYYLQMPPSAAEIHSRARPQ